MTTTETITLTADDLAALRKADSVCFQTTRDGSAIRACIEARFQPAVYTARQQVLYPVTDMRGRERHIAVRAGVTAYERDGGARYRPDFTAFEMVHSAQYDRVWPTIVGLLRVGDDVRLHWVAGNGTGYLDQAGLHRDELMIQVIRPKATLTFLLDTSVTPDNSARMVKVGAR